MDVPIKPPLPNGGEAAGMNHADPEMRGSVRPKRSRHPGTLELGAYRRNCIDADP